MSYRFPLHLNLDFSSLSRFDGRGGGGKGSRGQSSFHSWRQCSSGSGRRIQRRLGSRTMDPASARGVGDGYDSGGDLGRKSDRRGRQVRWHGRSSVRLRRHILIHDTSEDSSYMKPLRLPGFVDTLKPKSLSVEGRRI
uniref:Uncharacterized protein n=1 Tax=Oryza sativa subsp. japonica TaxID=39947 RepID=Q5VPQ3_ORYSJ|nr:hypothetical protein [Oryza sativa Japonica Group]BAD68572.1 hypothetical protein [Oryza sativa Japonica Group]